MGWTDKVTHVTKSAAKTAAKTVAPIAQDAGREIGESLIIALERIAEKATDRLCEQVAVQTDRIIDRLDQVGHSPPGRSYAKALEGSGLKQRENQDDG